MCPNLPVSQRGGSQPLDSGARSQAFRQQFLKVCSYIQICETTSISPMSHQSQAIWSCPLGRSHKYQGSRLMYMLLSGRCQWAGSRQRENTEMASTVCIPWEKLHNPLDMCQTWSLLPAQSARTSKEAPSQKDQEPALCLSTLFVQCSGGGSLPRTISPTATVSQESGTQASLATRASWSRAIPRASVTKPGAPDIQTTGPEAHKAPLQESDCKDSTHPPSPLERVTVSA